MQKITLINASNHVSLDGVSEAWKTAAGKQLTVQMHVLRGGVQEGQRIIDISNGEIALSVLPGRGMGIHKAVADDVRLGWDSPVHGPVNPAHVPLAEPSGLGWLDGFDELVARCGLQSNGAPEFDAGGNLLFGVHGRIANKPAQHVWVEFDEKAQVLRLCGEVYETRFLLFNLRLTATVELPFEGTAFRIHDKVTNLSAKPAEMQLLYHVNFGSPILEKGSKCVVPATTIIPRTPQAAAAKETWQTFQPPTPGFEEEVYFFDPLADEKGNCHALLHNALQNHGVELRWPKVELPCFSLWKHTAATEDGYVTGLEPATNYPNPRSFEGEQGRFVALAPGGSQDFHLDINLLQSASGVDKAIAELAKMQREKSTMLAGPQLPWCS